MTKHTNMNSIQEFIVSNKSGTVRAVVWAPNAHLACAQVWPIVDNRHTLFAVRA